MQSRARLLPKDSAACKPLRHDQVRALRKRRTGTTSSFASFVGPGWPPSRCPRRRVRDGRRCRRPWRGPARRPRSGVRAPAFALVVVHRDGIRRHRLQPARRPDRHRAAPRATSCSTIPTWPPATPASSASLTGRVLTPARARNGVYVRLRGPVDLQDGDHFLVGKQVLRFELVPDAERGLRARRRARRGGVRDARPAPLGAPAPAHARRRHPRHLPPDPPRGDPGPREGDIVFSEDEFMSRRHAQFSYRNGRGRLEDLGSSNGTFLRLRGPQASAGRSHSPRRRALAVRVG